MALFYLICFAVWYGWLASNGLLFSLLDPVFYLNRLDLTHNIFLLTGWLGALIKSNGLRLFFDLLYILLPLITVTLLYKNKGISGWFAIITATFGLLYSSFLASVSFISVEGCTAWVLVPLIFTANERKSWYLLHMVRLIFLIIFISTALWKIRAGGIFNIEQMSGILIQQHAYLLKDDTGVYPAVVRYLVEHPSVSYVLYLIGFIAELTFIAGLFTLKYDRLLALILFLFIIADYIIMGINYFTWLPFAAVLYYARTGSGFLSSYSAPETTFKPI